MPRRPARSTVSILPARRAVLTALVPASQVERLLVAEPENAEYVELKAGLVEVIAMTEDLVDGHPDAKSREAGADAKGKEADASLMDESVAGALCRVRASSAGTRTAAQQRCFRAQQPVARSCCNRGESRGPPVFFYFFVAVGRP